MMIYGLRSFFSVPAGVKGKIKFRISVLEDTTITPETFVYQPYFNYELCKIGDYQDSIKRVLGKNLFDKNNTTIYAGYFDYQGKITGKGTDNNADKWFYIPCKPNTTYTITKPLQETTSNNRFRIGTTSSIPENGTTLSNFWKMNDGETDVTHTITTSATANYLCIYYGKGSSLDDHITEVLDGLQIELGSVATTYEPYGSGIPCWYVYEEIGKTTLNCLTWLYDSGSARFYSNTLTDAITSSVNIRTKVLSNYFHFISSGAENGGIFYYYNGNNRQIYTYNESITVASDFQTWVATTLPKLYYFLEVPKYTLITNITLINQLNNLYNAKSYNNQTNIIQENNDLPFKLDVTTLSKEAI